MARNAVQVVVAELDRFIDDVMKKLALDVVALLSAAPSEGGTPVDTGWASANWIPYIGVAPGKPSGSRPDAGNRASRAAQEVGITNVALRFKHDKNDTITVSNAVPYIVDLNEGNSKQAGAGFVQRAIFKSVRDFRKTLRTELF